MFMVQALDSWGKSYKTFIGQEPTQVWKGASLG